MEERYDGAGVDLQALVQDLRAKLSQALPSEWEQKLNDDGVSYFENSATGETSWEVPPPAPPTQGQADGAQVAQLEKELKKLKKAEKKREAEMKGIALKETAMKSDINKMKSETRQAKKDAADAKAEAERQVRAAFEEIARTEMAMEDQMQRMVLEHVDIIPGIVRALRSRDTEGMHESMEKFRLVEQIEVAPVVTMALGEAIDEYNAHVELVDSLEHRIADLESQLAFEKQERQRENEEWRALVAERDHEIKQLKEQVASLEQHVAELETYIAQAEERHALELEKARQMDTNKIAALEAQLEHALQKHEDYMAEIAEMWRSDVPPPSLLRKYVIPIRERDAAERQMREHDKISVGSHVQAWQEESYDYIDAIVTAMKDDERLVEVRWKAGSDDPPVWVSLDFCYAVVPEDMYKQKDVAIQTDVAHYDDEFPLEFDRRPRSARGRMDGGLEEIDRRAAQALKEKAKRELGARSEQQVSRAAHRLFKMIDRENQGELTLNAVWDAIVAMSDVRLLLAGTPELQPLMRKEYLYLAWKATDEDDDITMPFPQDEFIQVCKHALELSRRDAQERMKAPIDPVKTIKDELVRMAAANQSESESGSYNSYQDVDDQDVVDAIINSASSVGTASQGSFDDDESKSQASQPRELQAGETSYEITTTIEGNDDKSEESHSSGRRSEEEEQESKHGSEEQSDLEQALEEDQDRDDAVSQSADNEDAFSENSSAAEEWGVSTANLISPWLSEEQTNLEREHQDLLEKQAALFEVVRTKRLAESKRVSELFEETQATLLNCKDDISKLVQFRDQVLNEAFEKAKMAGSLASDLEITANAFTKIGASISASSFARLPDRSVTNAAQDGASNDLDVLYPDSEAFQQTAEESSENGSQYQRVELTSSQSGNDAPQGGDKSDNGPEKQAREKTTDELSRVSKEQSIPSSQVEDHDDAIFSKDSAAGDDHFPELTNAKRVVCDFDAVYKVISRHLEAIEQIVSATQEESQACQSKRDGLESQIKSAQDERAFVQAQQKAQSQNDDPKQEEEKQRALQRLKQEESALDAKIAGLKEKQNAQDAKIQSNATHMRNLQDAEQKLRQGQRSIQGLEDEYKHADQEFVATQPKLLSLCQQRQTLKRAQENWENEVNALKTHSHEQDFVIQTVKELCDKLDSEKRHNDRALLQLVEHKEVLKARIEDAKLQLEQADNDIEKALAQERLHFAEIEVPKSLEWTEEKWQVETKMRKEITAKQCQYGREAYARLRAAIQAVEERETLRALFEHEITDSLADARDTTPNKDSSKVALADRTRRRSLQLARLRSLAQARESSWSQEAFEKLQGLSPLWIAERERARLEERVELSQEQTDHATKYYNDMSRRLEKTMKTLQAQNATLNEKLVHQKSEFDHELKVLAETADKAAAMLHQQLDDEKALNIELRRSGRERLQMTEEDLESLRRELQGRIDHLTQTLVQNRHWIHTLQEDLRVLKVEHENLQRLRARELVVCATQKDQLRQELEAMTQHSARLDNWVNSLKGEVKLLTDTIDAHKLEAERVFQENKRRAQWLQWEAWKRDETARTIGTNVDACFAFFAECLARLAGASSEYNQRIGANSGVPVLLALLNSSREEIRRNALTALTACSWDGHVDYRTLSHRAVSDWKRWVTGVATVTTIRWYREHQKEEAAGNPSLYTPCPLVDPGMTVVIHRNQVKVVPLSVAEGACGANLPNQERIGVGLAGQPSGTEVLMKIFSSSPDLHELEQAAASLAVLSLRPENRDRLLNIEDTMEKVLAYCELANLPSDSPGAGAGAGAGAVAGVGDGKSNDASPSLVGDQQDPELARAHLETQAGNPTEKVTEQEDIQLQSLSILANILFESEEYQIKFGKARGVERMLEILRTSNDVDVLERCSGVLINSTSLHGPNCERIGAAGGFQVLVDLCSSDLGQEALDQVGSRIQTNAAEILVNATKESTNANAKAVASFGVAGLIQMSFSPSTSVQQAAASILGNLAQDEQIRARLGEEGAVEALFTLCENQVKAIRRTALWALSSLAWNAHNQDSIGRQLPQLVRLCQDDSPQVRAEATAVLANCLFYHEGNRRRFGLFTKAIRTIVKLLEDRSQPDKVHENAARALGTAAYNDAVAMQAGILGAIPHLVRLASECSSVGVHRSTAFALGNLAVHDALKTLIVSSGGVEAMTALCGGSDCPEARRQADKVLKTLADMSRAEKLQERRKKYGVKGLVELCKGEAETASVGSQANMQALACDELNAEVSQSTTKVAEAFQHRGHFVLTQVVRESIAGNKKVQDPFQRKLTQRALWSIRTLVNGGHDTELCQNAFGSAGAISVIIEALHAHYPLAVKAGLGDHSQIVSDPTDTMSVNVVSSRDVCEAALSAMFVLVRDHGANCRRILTCDGLGVLVQIAEDNTEPAKPRTARPGAKPAVTRAPIKASRDSTLGHLVLELLQVIGPHAWISCQNPKCDARETSPGLSCSQCGHSLVAEQPNALDITET